MSKTREEMEMEAVAHNKFLKGVVKDMDNETLIMHIHPRSRESVKMRLKKE
jgi:hypothetical protein